VRRVERAVWLAGSIIGALVAVARARGGSGINIWEIESYESWQFEPMDD
jgi:hypothetical protein